MSTSTDPTSGQVLPVLHRPKKTISAVGYSAWCPCSWSFVASSRQRRNRAIAQHMAASGSEPDPPAAA